MSGNQNEITTLNEYINNNQSPQLEPTKLNLGSEDSPLPLNIEDDDSSNSSEPEGEGYEALNSAKGRYCRDTPQTTTNHQHDSPDRAEHISQPAKRSMVDQHKQTISHTSDDVQMLATPIIEASHRLDSALADTTVKPHYKSLYGTAGRTSLRLEAISSLVRDDGRTTNVTHAQSNLMPPLGLSQHGFGVKPPPRMSLPSIKTTSPSSGMTRMRLEDRSITSPSVLFALSPPACGTDQQLPEIYCPSNISTIGPPQVSRQTLPSLETTLSRLSAPSEPSFSGTSPSLGLPSPSQLPQYGTSPSAFTAASPAAVFSPSAPRVSTNPSNYITTNREYSNSISSEYNSTTSSNGISTPASSVPGLSPANSANHTAPTTIDPEKHHIDDMQANGTLSVRPLDDGTAFLGPYDSGSFRCTWTGCTAAPFQTQYLLNSHANVHSTQRPHFCSVEGCPRGPGGQGFKRKNEMIRHGLVHQSPGYVCPFCPDQQHKYPRPDNLQRHVRVHHVDRGRDDPALREVLAQRAEGGNRGRRRRLNS